jgi:hypothetical protein
MEIDLKRLTQSNLALIFDKTERTILRWHFFGLPKHGEFRGCYYVWSEVLPWYIAFIAGLATEDPEAKLAKVRPSPGPNYFRALDLMEQAQAALQGEAGTAFKRAPRKKTAKHSRTHPLKRRPSGNLA